MKYRIQKNGVTGRVRVQKKVPGIYGIKHGGWECVPEKLWGHTLDDAKAWVNEQNKAERSRVAEARAWEDV